MLDDIVPLEMDCAPDDRESVLVTVAKRNRGLLILGDEADLEKSAFSWSYVECAGLDDGLFGPLGGCSSQTWIVLLLYSSRFFSLNLL